MKSHVKYEFAMGLDNADHVANGISHYIKLTNDPASVNTFYALYDRITPDDLMAAAKKYFGPDNRTVLLEACGRERRFRRHCKGHAEIPRGRQLSLL